MRCRCWGRCNKKSGCFDFRRSKGSVFFRLPTFLLKLHFLSRSKDTSSVSAYADPPSPFRGSFAGCDTFRSLSQQGRRCFSTANLLIASARPVLQQRHLIRLADARHLPLQGEGLRASGAVLFFCRILAFRVQLRPYENLVDPPSPDCRSHSFSRTGHCPLITDHSKLPLTLHRRTAALTPSPAFDH